MVESSAQAQAAATPNDEQAIQREVAKRYQILQQEVQALVSRLMEVDDERKEHQLVLESISKLEDDRKCWRLVHGVMFEKTKAEVVPELEGMIANLLQVAKQLNDGLHQKKMEMSKLEQAYEHIMKAAKERKAEQIEAGEAKAGGVLV